MRIRRRSWIKCSREEFFTEASINPLPSNHEDNDRSYLRRVPPALSTLLALLMASTVSGQISGVGWDADDSIPPPVSRPLILPKPAKVKPFHLLVYQNCSADRGNAATAMSETRLDIVSAYGFAKFDAWSTDTTVQIIVRLRKPADTGLPVDVLESRRGRRRDMFRIPGKDFALSVILGRDTARFRVRQSGTFSVEYVKKSRLLILDAPRQIPADIVCCQLFDRVPEETRRLLDKVQEKFGREVTTTSLSPGFYPCLPALWITRTGLGHRRRVNETPFGHLVCFRVPYAAARSRFENWWREEQRSSFARETNDG